MGPDSFIPLAEESGLIVPIGRWVLEEACRQAAAWAAEGLQIGISVNVSAYQLGRKEFAEDVHKALQHSGIEPSSLTLEVTETMLMRNVPAACERLQEIKALGVRIAIDDFGTGYASLSQLQRMPVTSSRSTAASWRHSTTATRAASYSKRSSASAEPYHSPSSPRASRQPTQLATLEEMGCQMAQGYLMGHPTDAGHRDLLHSQRRASRGPLSCRVTRPRGSTPRFRPRASGRVRSPNAFTRLRARPPELGRLSP